MLEEGGAVTTDRWWGEVEETAGGRGWGVLRLFCKETRYRVDHVNYRTINRRHPLNRPFISVRVRKWNTGVNPFAAGASVFTVFNRQFMAAYEVPIEELPHAVMEVYQLVDAEDADIQHRLYQNIRERA